MSEPVEAILQTRSGDWLAFDNPIRLIRADSADAVGSALADVERLTRDLGFHAVGFVSYEAGSAFGLRTCLPRMDVPLVWFALFEPHRVRPIDHPSDERGYQVGPLAPSIDRQSFDRAFGRIKGFLADGDSYQVNFTFKMTGPFKGEPRALFADLVAAQKGAYSAFIRIGPWSICSASPELFFAVEGAVVRARPMKGTAPRGRTLEEDRRQRDLLRESAKQQAENVMIVDMVRNDLGRVADVGSVEVSELFAVERYPNVWQMTSEITARSFAPLEDLFAALHPSASVTGAPKVRTTQILCELEQGPRGVYTGAIGYIPPDGNASFNVAIRTAVVDEREGTVEFGIGSGIVWDSDAGSEYEECLLKGSVLGRRPPRFELLETMRWSPAGGFFLLDRHLDRLRDSAEYFGFVCDLTAVRAALHVQVSGEREARRVRLRTGEDGTIRIEHGPVVQTPGPLRVKMASAPIDSGDVYLFHKTTCRAAYDRAREAAGDADEVILWNEHRQVTEATTANVVVEIAGSRVTPPVQCGLLGGTFRADLIARGEIREEIVTIDDLRSASRVWLVNSVHEYREAAVAW